MNKFIETSAEMFGFGYVCYKAIELAAWALAIALIAYLYLAAGIIVLVVWLVRLLFKMFRTSASKGKNMQALRFRSSGYHVFLDGTCRLCGVTEGAYRHFGWKCRGAGRPHQRPTRNKMLQAIAPTPTPAAAAAAAAAAGAAAVPTPTPAADVPTPVAVMAATEPNTSIEKNIESLGVSDLFAQEAPAISEKERAKQLKAENAALEAEKAALEADNAALEKELEILRLNNLKFNRLSGFQESES